MSWSISIGRIAGTEIKIHLTLPLFFLWIWLSGALSRGSAEGADNLFFIVGLFACVLAHEFGHILTGRAFGIATPEVILLPIGGVARMSSIPQSAPKELLIAAAGPVVNIAIAVVLVGLFGAHLAFKDFVSGDDVVVPMLGRLATANVVLAIFNLIPAFPMDGGRVFRAFLAFWYQPYRATQIAASVGEVLAILLGFAGLLFNPMLVFISIFIYLAAASEAQVATLSELARDLPITSIMTTEIMTSPADSRIGDIAETFIHLEQSELPIVGSTGQLVGVVGRGDVALALKRGLADSKIESVMSDAVAEVNMTSNATDVIRLLAEQGKRVVGVVDRSGQLTGVVTPQSLTNLLLFKDQKRSQQAPWQSLFHPLHRT